VAHFPLLITQNGAVQSTLSTAFCSSSWNHSKSASVGRVVSPDGERCCPPSSARDVGGRPRIVDDCCDVGGSLRSRTAHHNVRPRGRDVEDRYRPRQPTLENPLFLLSLSFQNLLPSQNAELLGIAHVWKLSVCLNRLTWAVVL
jgi:hypothetical protein